MFASHAAIMTSAGLPPPTVTGISPTSFYTSRWVGFTVTGTNFVPDQTTASSSLATGGISVNSVNTAGTSLSLSIYSYYAGTAPVYITTPFGTASTQNITASVEPPPMSVSSAYRGYEFNGVFVPASSAVMVFGSGFTYNTQAYVSGAGWKSIAFYSSTQLYFNSGAAAAGSFFLYDSATGSGTGWVNYS